MKDLQYSEVIVNADGGSEIDVQETIRQEKETSKVVGDEGRLK